MSQAYDEGFAEGLKGEHGATASSCPYRDERRGEWFEGFDDGVLKSLQITWPGMRPEKSSKPRVAKSRITFSPRPKPGEYVRRRLAQIEAEHLTKQ